MNPNVAMFLSFVVVSVFTFISVAAWAGARAEERKAFYRSEMLKKLAESGSAAVVEYLHEEEKADERRRARQREQMLEGGRLTGLILVVVGLGMAVAFRQIVPDVSVYLLGLIPAGIGVVFLGNSMFARRS